MIRLVFLLLVSLAVVPGCCSRAETAEEQAKKASAAYMSEKYEDAKPIFESLAHTGDAQALCTLGFMYYTGRGVKRDLDKAHEYYRQASEKNHMTAQFSLGTMFHNGEGTTVDLEEAYFWYTLAARQGDKDADKLRNEIKRMLAAETISRVEERAQTWQPQS